MSSSNLKVELLLYEPEVVSLKNLSAALQNSWSDISVMAMLVCTVLRVSDVYA
jgi:hypothetical protein